jgi:hypothetical protein
MKNIERIKNYLIHTILYYKDKIVYKIFLIWIF